MKIYVAIVLTGLICITMQTKAQIHIQGKVVDENNNPLSYAHIKIKNIQQILNNIVCDSNGFFEIKQFKYAKNLQIQAAYLNDTSISYTIDSTNKNFVFTIGIKQLNEVVINTKKPLIERKADRLIFNVANSITTIGSNGLEAIAKTPGLRVLKDEITMVGRSNLAVMINDKLTPLAGDDLINYLKSLSADDIEKIEVITNPPAIYSAEGNSGLLNIVLKRNARLGYNGTARFGSQWNTYNTLSSGLNFNYNTKKIKYYLQSNFANGASAALETSNINYTLYNFQQNINRKDYTNFYNTNIGTEFTLNKKNSLDISYQFRDAKPNIDENDLTTYQNIYKNYIDSFIKTNAFNSRTYFRQSTNLHFVHNIDSLDKKLIVDIDWFKDNATESKKFVSNNYDSNIMLIPNSYNSYITNANSLTEYYTINGLFELPYKNFNIELGGKLSFIHNNYDYKIYIDSSYNNYYLNKSISSIFDYTENTQALFFNFSKKINKVDIQAGLRAENTQLKGSNNNLKVIDSNYLQLFPTFYFTYNASENHNFGFNYGRRIGRPPYYMLDPARDYSIIKVYSIGNPLLQPSISNNIELSYTYKDVFTNTLFYSFTENVINQFADRNNNNDIIIFKRLNTGTNIGYGYTSSLILKPAQWLESNNQITFFYNTANSSIPQISTNMGYGYSFSTDNQIILNKNKTILGGINFWYNAPNKDGFTVYGESYALNLSLKCRLVENKLLLSFNYDDIFKSSSSTYSDIYNNIKGSGFNYYDVKNFKLTIQYKFGNKKITKQEKESKSIEERNRL